MQIELGNHAANTPDGAPAVTTIHIPEADEQGLGGYSHKPGAISVDEFKSHRQDAMDFKGGITSLPDHEALLAVVHAWPTQSAGPPRWVNVTAHATLGHQEEAADIEKFLQEYYHIEHEMPSNVEAQYHTRFGAPGVGPMPGEVVLPPITNLFTNNGRVIANVNDGGGQVGAIGAGTAATATTLTTASTYTLNQWAGYRVVCYSTTSNNMVWMNVVSNTSGANSVLTGDQWYVAATPGGTAGTTPTTPWAFMLLDGGFTSAWFIGLATGVNVPAAADTTLATNGNVEWNHAGGGYMRKISPYAQTSGVATRSITLSPVYTGNGSDTYPATFTTIGVFTSMVAGTAGTMKFETALNASATVAASGDQISVVETINGT